MSRLTLSSYTAHPLLVFSFVPAHQDAPTTPYTHTSPDTTSSLVTLSSSSDPGVMRIPPSPPPLHPADAIAVVCALLRSLLVFEI